MKHLSILKTCLSLLLISFLLLGTSCTKNDDDIECPDCENIVIEDIINP